jgi:hypothetical protein
MLPKKKRRKINFNIDRIFSFTICPQSRKTQSAISSIHILHNSVSLAAMSPSSLAEQKGNVFSLISRENELIYLLFFHFVDLDKVVELYRLIHFFQHIL